MWEKIHWARLYAHLPEVCVEEEGEREGDSAGSQGRGRKELSERGEKGKGMESRERRASTGWGRGRERRKERVMMLDFNVQ